MPKQKHEEKKEGGKSKGKSATCLGCAKEFVSKNALFRHLRCSGADCLSPDEYKKFLRYVVNNDRNMEKTAILFGYLPSAYYLEGNGACEIQDATISGKTTGLKGISGGDQASALLVQALSTVSLGTASDDFDAPLSSRKVDRSYGSLSCGPHDALFEQDERTSMTEVLCVNVPPLIAEENDDASSDRSELKMWLEKVNDELDRLLEQIQRKMVASDENSDLARAFPGLVRVFDRTPVVQKKFNAEKDVSLRKIEYLLPLDFLFSPPDEGDQGLGLGLGSDRQSFFDKFPCFKAGVNSKLDKDQESSGFTRPDPTALAYLYKVKAIMQRLTTNIEELKEDDQAAVLEKERHEKKRKRQKERRQQKQDERRKENNEHKKPDDNVSGDAATVSNPIFINLDKKVVRNQQGVLEKSRKKQQRKTVHVLKRKRYHNFTKAGLAHEFQCFRRMDRFYHKSTIRYNEGGDLGRNNRPFLLLSLSGDRFLNGQACSVVGLLIAICRGIIGEDIIDCIFDEEYPSLVPAPMAPRIGLYSAEAMYVSWEGRLKTILSPRHCGKYSKGFNSEETITAIHQDWRSLIHRKIAESWVRRGFTGNDGRLVSEKKWVEEYLVPWGENTREQLLHYRRFTDARQKVAANPGLSLVDALLPPPESIDDRSPQLYRKVLDCLRDANLSGKWPDTTPKRQLVIFSTNEDGSAATKSLSSALFKAKTSKERSSAYTFQEGQGGASGSFSLGAFPPDYDQPKANDIFPELMKAAFELEIALCPDREPSSTIAINRNAQFRPHTDSGAGAGQSTSLIVGIGKFVGGALMVEGKKEDIRYRPIEFNGWIQRHWVLPFRGERFSLVWFTPKGCEGIHGIDLCQTKPSKLDT